MDARAAVAELMAECPGCGAITTQALEIAWRARTVTCTECKTSMSVGSNMLSVLCTASPGDNGGVRDDVVRV
jgi:hypothetical protein